MPSARICLTVSTAESPNQIRVLRQNSSAREIKDLEIVRTRSGLLESGSSQTSRYLRMTRDRRILLDQQFENRLIGFMEGTAKETV